MTRRAHHSSRDEDPPSGYSRVRLDMDSELFLPQPAADALRQDMQQRESQAEEKRQEDLRRRREDLRQGLEASKPSTAEQTSSPDTAYPTAPQPGWHRVLPALRSLARELEDPMAQTRSADRDVNDRRLRVLRKLVAAGPDRRIARAPDWRPRLDALEAALPHFRGPIRALRNTLALAQATGVTLRVPPLLLLGPPGVGKTYFCHQVAELMGAPYAALAFDQPSAGGQLRGSDKYWANSESGLLFNLICMGECANPVVLLDELDKSAFGGGTSLNPLAQLHGVLEPETARRLVDSSVEVEFDASLVTYVATANSVQGVSLSILSRMEVFCIAPPSRDEAYDIAQAIAQQVLRRVGLDGQMTVERRAVCLLAHLSPRLMIRAVEQATAAAVEQGRRELTEEGVWAELQPVRDGPPLH